MSCGPTDSSVAVLRRIRSTAYCNSRSRADDGAVPVGYGVVHDEPSPDHPPGAELAAVAATFLLFSLLHLGVSIGPLSDAHNLGTGGLAEAILGVCALVAFVATCTRPASAWTWGVVANGVATAGVVLGIYATRGGTTELNFVYHRTVLGVVALSLVVLIIGRAAPRLRHSPIQ